MNTTYKLLISSPDEKGIIYKVSKILYEANLNIQKQNEFVDKDTNMFYLKTNILGQCDTNAIIEKLKNTISKEANIEIKTSEKKNIIIFATKESHILGDMLIKHNSDNLNANILAVVSNHNDLEELTSKFDIPYYYVSHNRDKEEYEQDMINIINKHNADYIVLAKYMRILSEDFTNTFKNKIINIHHSFLPAFIGQKPYHQAFKRGVKIIGATAHYATSSLDEGPIIYQDIIKIDHTFNAQEMKKYGQNVEKIVLANALDLVFNDRVFVHKNKTIIL